MSDQSPFDPPSSSSFGSPSGPPTQPMPSGPIAPKSSPWKPAALGFGAAAVLGAGIFGIVQLAGDDDAPTAELPGGTIPAVTLPADLQEQVDDAVDDAEDLLDSVPAVPSIPALPSVPEGEPTDSAVPGTTPGATESDADVTISIPGGVPLDEISECLGLGDLLGDLDLGDLGSLPTGSIPNFEELTPEELAGLDMAELLEQVFAQIDSELPMGSIPFDMSILDDLDLGNLGDMSEMSPEQIQELIESQLGALGSIPPMSIPEMGSIPTLDPAELEECFADLAPQG